MLISPVILPPDIYPIIKTGIKSSFAGNDSTNATSIYPSSPIAFAKGFKNSTQCINRLMPPKDKFDKSQMISPAGAATEIALHNTKSVLSKTDLTIIFEICGLLYGGSSKAMEEGTPFSKVTERSFDVKSVKKTARTIAAVSITADNMDL